MGGRLQHLHASLRVLSHFVYATLPTNKNEKDLAPGSELTLRNQPIEYVYLLASGLCVAEDEVLQFEFIEPDTDDDVVIVDAEDTAGGGVTLVAHKENLKGIGHHDAVGVTEHVEKCYEREVVAYIRYVGCSGCWMGTCSLMHV